MSPIVVFLALAVPLLFFAAARDVATRLIPDPIPIAIGVIGVATRLVEGWAAAGTSLLLAAAVFILLVPIAARGWLGGGDVKLLSAMAVGLSPGYTWDFVVATVFVGGALGVAYILGRRLAPETRVAGGATLLRRVLAVEAWRMRRRGPLPYAVAIAGGGLLLLISLPRA
ncbi:A24 family peptidase [Roseomonas fluvialis]|uniref:Prepilin peptidase n=1 Tax=Roseomonas fluvialis TaxID=1750527 RepID=A0ABM7Y5H9_9PROT|nr:prepilin peptidase [Roseomonas fluvialis]BDG73203.1 prepilin peptidase [Roseomonas fluvialis]